jgi:hypothetical protein
VVASTFPSQISQDGGVVIVFRNKSADTCMLNGTPHIVATGNGLADTVLPPGPGRGITTGSWNMKTGETTSAWVRSSNACDGNTTDAERAGPHFTELVVSVPGGGALRVAGVRLHARCTSVTTYWRDPPPAVYPADPMAGVMPTIALPSVVRAGQPFYFVVSLTNPTGHDASLTPCPQFLDWAGNGNQPFFKTVYTLNCDGRTALSAGETVRFQMRGTVPADAASHPMQVYWTLFGSDAQEAQGTVVVSGNDHPCTSSQLAATATDPAVSFEREGIFDAKDAGTRLTVGLINTSTSACTLQGNPAVALAGADDRDLGIPFTEGGYGRVPAAPQVVLAANGGRASTVLAWHTQWCRAVDRVTVRLTLPDGGGTVTVVPLHGWTPPPCNGFAFNTLSSDSFQPVG